MSIVYILLVLLTVADILWCLSNMAQRDVLDEREQDLDKYSVHLDERANKLAMEEEEIRKMRAELQKNKERKNELDAEASERYGYLVSVAEEVSGWKLTGTRSEENVLIRTFVAYRMREEGFSYERIGRAMHRNHSTITHLVKKMEDMLSLPAMYRGEITIYNKFTGVL